MGLWATPDETRGINMAKCVMRWKEISSPRAKRAAEKNSEWTYDVIDNSYADDPSVFKVPPSVPHPATPNGPHPDDEHFDEVDNADPKPNIPDYENYGEGYWMSLARFSTCAPPLQCDD